MLKAMRLSGNNAKIGRSDYALSCLLLASIVATGCRSHVFRASNLPAEYRTASIANHSHLNLAGLSSPGYSNSLLAPGDLLEVIIASGHNDEKLVPTLARVSSDGAVELSSIGSVQVAGLEPFEASQNIATASIERGIYLKPNVTVSVQSKAVNQITVLGEVDSPGVHEIPRNACDLISALGAAGGLTENASTTVEIIRHTPTILASNDTGLPSNDAGHVQQATYANLDNAANTNAAYATKDGSKHSMQSQRIDLAAVSPHKQADYRLKDRDVVMVHPHEKRLIHVAGLVKKPGQFELPSKQDVHLLDAIALAGGLDSVVADKVYIIRRIEGKLKPLVIQASLNKAKYNGRENIRIAAGDTINVERTPATVAVDTFSNLFRISMGITGRTSFY